MNLTLVVWRQESPEKEGKFVTYPATDISADMSFLEMLDVVNEGLTKKNERPIEFDSDCREGICGTCGCMVNGQAHGPLRKVTLCQLHMRSFKDGDSIIIEPFRAKAFPIIKDLVVDRSAFDRIQQAGGYVTVKTGPQPDGNNILISKESADRAMDASQCIGCGACVAACPNASASLFIGAKIAQYTFLPQGQVEAKNRAIGIVNQHDAEGFGNCTNIGECHAVCPKDISIQHIAIMKSEFIKAKICDKS